jgi:hypothetical protein
MLNITSRTLTLEPQEVMELIRIIIDDDREGAFQFLKKNIYQRFITSQENRLKSHLDGCSDPGSTFSGRK